MKKTYSRIVNVDCDYELLGAIRDEIYKLPLPSRVIQVIMSTCHTQALVIFEKEYQP